MQLWLKTLIRNSFFQVGIGLFITMIFGGIIVLQWLETGIFQKGIIPFGGSVTMTTVGYGDFSETLKEEFLQYLLCLRVSRSYHY